MSRPIEDVLVFDKFLRYEMDLSDEGVTNDIMFRMFMEVLQKWETYRYSVLQVD